MPSGKSFISAPERCSVGGPHSSMASATPRPFEPFVAVRLRLTPLPLSSAALDDVEALVDAVAAEARRRSGSFQIDSMRSVSRTLFLRRISNGLEASSLGQLVHGAFDGEGGLRGAVAAEAAGRDHVGVDGVAVGLLVGAAIGGDRAAERGGQRLAAVVCRRRRCWRRRGRRSRSACRPSWRRA